MISSRKIFEKKAIVTYKIEFETRSRREYRDLPATVQEQLGDSLDDLQINPRPPGCKKLIGTTGYRIRIGKYRILYTIDDAASLVRVYRIGHRRDVYR